MKHLLKNVVPLFFSLSVICVIWEELYIIIFHFYSWLMITLFFLYFSLYFHRHSCSGCLIYKLHFCCCLSENYFIISFSTFLCPDQVRWWRVCGRETIWIVGTFRATSLITVSRIMPSLGSTTPRRNRKGRTTVMFPDLDLFVMTAALSCFRKVTGQEKIICNILTDIKTLSWTVRQTDTQKKIFWWKT